MADIEITGLTAILYAALAAVDEFAIEDIDAGETKRVALSEIKKYVLDNGTIGGTTAGDPVDIDSAQTLTNKRLTSPQINEAVAVTATATEINKLAGCTSSTAELNKLTGLLPTVTELNYVDGVTSAIQTQINALAASTETTFTKTHTYQYGFTLGLGVTTLDRTQAQILGDMGLSTASYVIDHAYITAQLWQVQAGVYTNVVLESGGANVAFDIQTIGGQAQLDTVSLSGMTAEKEYNLVMTFKIAEKAGA